LGELRCRERVLARQDPGCAFDHGDPAAEAGEGLAQLAADAPATEDYQLDGSSLSPQMVSVVR